MKKLLSIFACVLVLALCFTACAPAVRTDDHALARGGVLRLAVNPEIAISFDDSGNVTNVEARNDDGSKIVADYTGFEGKACKTVVAELVTAIGEAGYFVEDVDGERRQIILEIEPGSKLPTEGFLNEIAEEVRVSVNLNDWSTPVELNNEIVPNCTNPYCDDVYCDDLICDDGICTNPYCDEADCDDADCDDNIPFKTVASTTTGTTTQKTKARTCTNPYCDDADCDDLICDDGICTNPYCDEADCDDVDCDDNIPVQTVANTSTGTTTKKTTARTCTNPYCDDADCDDLICDDGICTNPYCDEADCDDADCDDNIPGRKDNDRDDRDDDDDDDRDDRDDDDDDDD